MSNSKIGNLINKIIFFVYIFLSIYEVYIGELVGNVTRFYLIIFVAFLFLNTYKKPLNINQILILLWLFMYYVSLLWTPNIHQATLYIGTVTVMSLSAILCENCYFSRVLMTEVVSMYKWCSVSMAILGVFFSQPIDFNNSIRMVLTIGGVQPDPNNLVALYAVGSGLTLFDIKKGRGNKIANLIGLLLCIYCILIAGSRSGILILGIQFLIWFFYVNRDASFVTKTLALILFSAATVYVMFSYVNVETIERMFGLGDLEFTDGTGREDQWKIAIDKFCNGPIIGNGWGTYSAHNTFLTFLVDVGVVGTGLIVIYLIRLFKRILKSGDSGALAIFISGFVQSFLIDAQNKRFFWNIIILSVLIINSYAHGTLNSKNTPENKSRNKVEDIS